MKKSSRLVQGSGGRSQQDCSQLESPIYENVAVRCNETGIRGTNGSFSSWSYTDGPSNVYSTLRKETIALEHTQNNISGAITDANSGGDIRKKLELVLKSELSKRSSIIEEAEQDDDEGTEHTDKQDTEHTDKQDTEQYTVDTLSHTIDGHMDAVDAPALESCSFVTGNVSPDEGCTDGRPRRRLLLTVTGSGQVVVGGSGQEFSEAVMSIGEEDTTSDESL